MIWLLLALIGVMIYFLISADKKKGAMSAAPGLSGESFKRRDVKSGTNHGTNQEPFDEI